MVCYHETVDLFTSKGGVIPGGCGRFPVSVYFEEMGLFNFIVARIRRVNYGSALFLCLKIDKTMFKEVVMWKRSLI